MVNMSTDFIKRCPFCGGEVTTFSKKFIDGLKFGVMCKETFCCIIPANFNTKEEAIKAWNTRKPMDDIVDELEEEMEMQWDYYNKAKATGNIRQMDYSDGCAEGLTTAIEIVKEVGGSCD